MEKFNAAAHQEGQWWVIEIPELGQTTQARTDTAIEKMAIDLVAVTRNVNPAEVQVNVTMRPGS